jgi:hypothetical protein
MLSQLHGPFFIVGTKPKRMYLLLPILAPFRTTSDTHIDTHACSLEKAAPNVQSRTRQQLQAVTALLLLQLLAHPSQLPHLSNH